MFNTKFQEATESAQNRIKSNRSLMNRTVDHGKHKLHILLHKAAVRTPVGPAATLKLHRRAGDGRWKTAEHMPRMLMAQIEQHVLFLSMNNTSKISRLFIVIFKILNRGQVETGI